MNNKIFRIIEEKGLYITDITKNSGCSRSYLYDVANGKSKPTLAKARKIAKALGETLETVFPDKEDSNEYNTRAT